ncbi:MAG: DUF4860 domain-containing protein [Oscillospiraceae bacterium]|nr:DUF4860 domain-containing protein [Oscillospiraceae bacterium]
MRRQSGAGTLAALALTCVFGATLLLSLAAGASVYRRVADRVEQSAGDRVSLSYITAKLHGFDAAGMVEAGQYGDGDAVFLYEDFDGLIYETILYVYDGQLREMLCEKGWEQDPEFGEIISPAQALQVGQPAPGLLRLSLTGESGLPQIADVYVRSVG